MLFRNECSSVLMSQISQAEGQGEDVGLIIFILSHDIR